MALINEIKKYYTNIPIWVTDCLAPFYYMIPQKKRYGTVFESQLKKLEEVESYSKDQVQNLINKQLILTIKDAYENVPYYKNLFDKKNISISSIKEIKDIQKIPFLTKENLIDNKEELLSRHVDKSKLQYITTSGSTGNPVGFYVDEDSTMKEWAYTLYLWKRVGYRPDSSRLLLRGKTFWAQKNKSKNWQYDALRRELSCNIFDLNNDNLEDYCKAIEKYKPEFIHGYMSATVILCKYIESRPNKLKHQFKAVLAVSENVLDNQREYVEKILNTRVFSFYGHSERLVIAGECEYSTEYHIEPLYGYAEIIDEDGNSINDGSVGELVTTGFCNKGMPMLRYRTGDLASWSNKDDCKCGRPHLRLAKVHGRWKQDVLINSDNAPVSLTAINMHSDVFDKVIRYQFLQEVKGEVVMKILANRDFTNEDYSVILKELDEKTKGKIKYRIDLVDNIPLKPNGKYSIIDQRLKVSQF
ncbi:hypothetical protein M4S82_03945 [Planococcus sp. MERTA32b]|nr:hypothetical protein [Planococcus sp. MER TA 32b]